MIESERLNSHRIPDISMSCIERLPPELLAEVFTLCALSDSTTVASIAAVARKWRDLLYSSPRAWQYLTIEEYPIFELHGTEQRRSKANMWLDRSKPLPFDFKFMYCNSDTVITMLSYILPEVGRWREATFLGPCASMIRFSLAHDGKTAHIDQLNISVSNSDHHGLLMVDEDVQFGDNAIGDNDWGSIASATHSFVDLPGRLASVTLTVFHLPDPTSLRTFSTLSHLNIVNLDFDVEIPTHEVINFLAMCPALEKFALGNAPSHEPEPPETCNGIDIVALPRLRILKLVSVHAIRCFLSHLITPTLESLFLLHINLALQFPSPTTSDPGDSDDEAHDFSQSPWTDHATGMGLRLLYSRCQPPLQSLDMDYADLRTKDFRWAFQTFRHLSVLRIVASDMSDNVARALRPSNGWTPLPSLTHLIFVHCQRLTGESIVEMIESRIIAAEAGFVAPLTKFTVDRCSGFNTTHYLLLRKIFRPLTGLIYIL